VIIEVCFVHFCRLLDELNISTKTGMLCFAVSVFSATIDDFWQPLNDV